MAALTDLTLAQLKATLDKKEASAVEVLRLREHAPVQEQAGGRVAHPLLTWMLQLRLSGLGRGHHPDRHGDHGQCCPSSHLRLPR